jgi:hypothetical protein
MDKSFIHKTNDGNYILAGTTNNVLLLKLSSDGSFEWDYEYEADQSETDDIWILKLNPQGDVLWQKTYGNWDYETASAIEQTEDGGFIIAARTDSFDVFKLNKGDAWVLKLDKNANIEWEYTYGGAYNDVITHIQQTADMGYIASGYTNGFGTGEPGTQNYEAWLLKLDSLGNISGCPGSFIESSNEHVSETNIKKKDYERAGETPLTEDTPVDPAMENTELIATNTLPQVICLDPSQDSDNDGMSDQEEFGPEGNNTGYDGNNDGRPDSRQENVASCHTYDSENYVTLACPEEVSLRNVLARDNPSPSNSPPDVDFGFGFFEFEIHGLSAGDSTLLTIYLPDESTQNTYYKYGPTEDNASTHWYRFLYENNTGAKFKTGYVILHFKDGVRGDEDLIANGIITDLGGPGIYEGSNSTNLISSQNNKINTLNYPNPFIYSTSICFKLEKSTSVKIEIYDILGHKVYTIKKNMLPQGYHEIEFFSDDLPPGIYFYYFEAGSYYDIQKMIIQK